jgi:exopolyphosphatase/guanosine-5'-triphosphate,3'-diphosphate pyrophosphatase
VTGPSDEGRAAAREPCGPEGLRDGAEDRHDAGDRPKAVSTGPARDNKGSSGKAAGGKKAAAEKHRRSKLPAYGALDLGTNNCRLLVARPSRRGFVVIDAFSRIIRLGEGVSHSGRLSDEAMERTIRALKICRDKMRRRGVRRSRLISTQACRIADNSEEFIGRVCDETGLELEIVSRETEARLAVSGCASLLDPSCDGALIFDIGGGSSELIWLDLSERSHNWRSSVYDRLDAQNCISAWTSLPVGVVTLAEKYGGRHVTPELFDAMVEDVSAQLAPFEKAHGLYAKVSNGSAHLLGTSGTVTTIAGVKLQLPAYDRRRVDGCWLQSEEVRDVSSKLIGMSYDQRVEQPCIGPDRADLVLAGCAILEALMRIWPCQRLRVADRGLREGMLATMMAEDGYRHSSRRRRWRHGRPSPDRN